MRLPRKTPELLAAKAATAPTMTLGNKTSEKRGAARTCQASAEAATELGLDFDRCVVGICELIGIVVVVDGEPVACATELRRKQEANTTMSTPGKEHQAKEWAGKAGSEQRNARTRVHKCDCGRPEPPKLYSYYWHSYRYDSPAGPGRAGPAANALQEPLAKSTARVSKASGTALSEGGAADEAGRRTSGLRQVASDDLAIPPCERAVREQPQAAQRQYIQQHFH